MSRDSLRVRIVGSVVVVTVACGSGASRNDGGAVLLPDAGDPDEGAQAQVDGGIPEAGPTLADGVVRLREGTARGVRDGETWSFRALPYAAPPVGALRFRPAEPPAPWEGVRDASTFGSTCVQLAVDTGEVVGGEEDCLTINVWTPADDEGARLPVMVWIHGGWFGYGSALGRDGITSGEDLAAAGPVVVVSFGYRLNALGFLAHPALSAESDHQVSGNYGLLDQIAALEWVRDQIAAFGGDPERVTIFGQSAGGSSVCALLVSPLARGLFAGAIQQSGACWGEPALADLEAVGVQLAEAVRCEGGPDVIECLRSRAAEEIAAAVPYRFGADQFVWHPNVDGWVLPDIPWRAAARGEQASVPILLGSTEDEMSSQLHLWLPRGVRGADGLRAACRTLFGESVGELVVDEYPLQGGASAWDVLVAATTDAWCVCPTRRIARTFAWTGSDPVWRYVFAHAFSRGPYVEYGAYHGVELGYVFHSFAAVDQPVDAAEEALSREVMAHWTRFAATGDPNPDGGQSWAAVSPADDLWRFDTPSAAGTPGPHCDFWDDQL